MIHHGPFRHQRLHRHHMSLGMPDLLDTSGPRPDPTQCYIGHKSLDKAIGLYQKTYPGGSQDEFVHTFSVCLTINQDVLGIQDPADLNTSPAVLS